MTNKKAGEKMSVPVTDPYVRDRLRLSPIKRHERKQRKIDFNRTVWAESDIGIRRIRRRRDMLIGFFFAMLALVIFVLVSLMTPRMVVNLEGDQGTVIINGEEFGRTGETLGDLNLGWVTIKVQPDNPEAVVEPESLRVKLGYSLAPEIYDFQISTQAVEEIAG